MAMNRFLVAGGFLSAAAAALHLAVIAGGPEWYRFFGAGDELADLAAQGSWIPALTTVGIAAVLAIWSAYAFSGAGVIPRLPLARTALILISGIYLLRGLVLVPALMFNGGAVAPFVFWSSLIVLIYGLVYAVGTWTAWRALSERPARA